MRILHLEADDKSIEVNDRNKQNFSNDEGWS